MHLALSQTGPAGCCLHFCFLVMLCYPPAKTSQSSIVTRPRDSDRVFQKTPRKAPEMGFSCQMPIYAAYGLRDRTFSPRKTSNLQTLIKLCPSREDLSVWGHSSVSSASLTSKPSFAYLMPISLRKHS